MGDDATTWHVALHPHCSTWRPAFSFQAAGRKNLGRETIPEPSAKVYSLHILTLLSYCTAHFLEHVLSADKRPTI